jgi:hypothetical protein
MEAPGRAIFLSRQPPGISNNDVSADIMTALFMSDNVEIFIYLSK